MPRSVPRLAAIAALCLLGPAACNDTRAAADDSADTAADVSTAAPDDAGAGDTGAIDDPGPDTTPDVAQPDVADAAVGSSCIPWDDQCPEGTYCQYADGDLRCVAEGDVIPDPGGNNPECPTGVCSRGGICMPEQTEFGFGDGRFICYQPCDATQERGETGCFNGRHTCWPAFDGDDPLAFGVCAY